MAWQQHPKLLESFCAQDLGKASLLERRTAFRSLFRGHASCLLWACTWPTGQELYELCHCLCEVRKQFSKGLHSVLSQVSPFFLALDRTAHLGSIYLVPWAFAVCDFPHRTLQTRPEGGKYET